MIQLPQVTLVCADSLFPEQSIKVLEHCKKSIQFGDVKLFTDKITGYEHEVYIPPLNSLIDYSVFMLTKAHEFIKTDYVLIVQRDGWILNPDKWNNDWLELDYVAPLFMQTYADGERVGSGGFSLRSKRIMERAAKDHPKWDGTKEHAKFIQSAVGYYEDGVISFRYKNAFRIATNEQSADFAHGGNRNPLYFRERPFGFHRTFADIDFKTGLVSYDLSKDLKISYDEEINSL